ncbi:hypothetical protein HMPREF1092_01330 [Clostridium thermobutyricum]|uniref:HTH deoR-type domain-containing protein n=1 Tax=Clostridium thermobutyricum TaxID=29372 RepID=N9WGV1_9CLOT|nr:DeoR/GlpR family DNA-binding transcription regulator [Clostridium thermobutyricum]ENZ02095.1 hypothetical protein HMPREF1092_01330 [Clostridium thermobutyricum]
MLTEKRYEVILDLLDENEVIKSSTIAGATNSSESTIRRDLIVLEKRGLLKRIHGGAKSLSDKLNSTLSDKKVEKNIHEKRLIGELSANLIEENDYIFIDGSETAKFLIKNINGKNIFVFTNSLKSAELLGKLKIKSYLFGGNITSNLCTFGENVINEINKISFDKVFFETDGIDIKCGFTTKSVEDSKIKEALYKKANEVYILADNGKFNKIEKVKFLDIDKGFIITDEKSDINEFNKEKIIVVKQ